MESIWTVPCGLVHVKCSMDSIWTVPWIPYGIVHGFAIEIHWKFHEIHMESIWTLHGPVHGMHHSMCSPYGIHSGYGLTKWLGTQPKNSPYGIHGLGGGIHPVHMESIWNHPESVKTSFGSTNIVLRNLPPASYTLRHRNCARTRLRPNHRRMGKRKQLGIQALTNGTDIRGPPLDLGFPNYVLIRICDASSATIYKELFECVISKYRIEEEVEKVLALASHALPWPNYFAGGCKNLRQVVRILHPRQNSPARAVTKTTADDNAKYIPLTVITSIVNTFRSWKNSGLQRNFCFFLGGQRLIGLLLTDSCLQAVCHYLSGR